jgi:hypothetical protein
MPASHSLVRPHGSLARTADAGWVGGPPLPTAAPLKHLERKVSSFDSVDWSRRVDDALVHEAAQQRIEFESVHESSLRSDRAKVPPGAVLRGAARVPAANG